MNDGRVSSWIVILFAPLILLGRSSNAEACVRFPRPSDEILVFEDSGVLYRAARNGRLIASDTETGKILWEEQSLINEVRAQRPWPLYELKPDGLIVLYGQNVLEARRQRDGEIAWRAEFLERVSDVHGFAPGLLVFTGPHFDQDPARDPLPPHASVGPGQMTWFDPSGRQRWSRRVENAELAAAFVGFAKGRVVVPTSSSAIVLDAGTGQEVSGVMPIGFPFATVGDMTLMTSRMGLFAVDAYNGVRWRFVGAPERLDGDRVIFRVREDLAAVRASDGKVIHRVPDSSILLETVLVKRRNKRRGNSCENKSYLTMEVVDLRTDVLRWSAQRELGVAHAYEVAGQLLILDSRGRLEALDLKTGEPRWKYGEGFGHENRVYAVTETTIAFKTSDGVVGLDVTTGRPKWLLGELTPDGGPRELERRGYQFMSGWHEMVLVPEGSDCGGSVGFLG